MVSLFLLILMQIYLSLNVACFRLKLEKNAIAEQLALLAEKQEESQTSLKEETARKQSLQDTLDSEQKRVSLPLCNIFEITSVFSNDFSKF